MSVYDPLAADTGFVADRRRPHHRLPAGRARSPGPLPARDLRRHVAGRHLVQRRPERAVRSRLRRRSRRPSRSATRPNFVFPLAQSFQYSGNDVIDASALDAALPERRNCRASGSSIYGGAGNDTIIGSQTGDILAGGSGNDTILGERGDDLIYGDNGINVDVLTRVLTVADRQRERRCRTPTPSSPATT